MADKSRPEFLYGLDCVRASYLPTDFRETSRLLVYRDTAVMASNSLGSQLKEGLKDWKMPGEKE